MHIQKARVLNDPVYASQACHNALPLFKWDDGVGLVSPYKFVSIHPDDQLVPQLAGPLKHDHVAYVK